MTFGWGGGSLPDGWSEQVLTKKEAEDCLIPMGFTSENVASDFGISRETQDKFAAQSFQKAAAAQKAGKFKDEIVPLKVKVIDPKTEKAGEIVVDADEGIRDGVTAESLAKLKPSFKKDGSTHAGKTSSQTSLLSKLDIIVQGMLLRSRMVLLLSYSPVAPWLNASAFPSLANTLQHPLLVSHLGSWEWVLPTLFPKFSRRLVFPKTTLTFTRSTKRSRHKPYTVLRRSGSRLTR